MGAADRAAMERRDNRPGAIPRRLSDLWRRARAAALPDSTVDPLTDEEVAELAEGLVKQARRKAERRAAEAAAAEAAAAEAAAAEAAAAEAAAAEAAATP